MKSHFTVLLAIVVAGLALAACSTPGSRIAKNQAAFDAYPTAVQEKIRAGEVEVGFTAEQVTLALGEPDRVSTRTDANGSAEVWSYRDKKPSFGFGFGVGGGSGSTGMGAGVGVSSGRDYPDEKMRVILRGGKVYAVEMENRVR